MSQKISEIEFANSSNVKSVKEIINDFAGETTAHGIPRIIDRPRLVSKIFWLVFVVIAFGVFFMQTTSLLTDFYAFNTKINLINNESVAFPAVTVCNLNKLKRSLLTGNTRWAEIARNEDILDLYENGTIDTVFGIDKSERDTRLPQYNDTEQTTEQDEEILYREKREDDEYNWYYDSSVDEYGDKSDTISDKSAKIWDLKSVTPSREELRELGHRAADFIIECRFNSRRCDDKDFKTIQNRVYGNCFTFNGNTAGKSAAPKVTKAGSDFGLHLTLFIEHNEYVGTLTEEAGVRIMSHPRDIMPHPEDVGLSVSPGFSSNIAIRQVEIRRLPKPHGTCTDGIGNKYLSNDTYGYSIMSCEKKCFQDEMVEKCKCVSDIYYDYDGIVMCDRSHRMCRQSIEKKFYSNEIKCNCPAPCREFIYNTQTTSSRWPDDRNFHIFREELNLKGKYVAFNELTDVNVARENLVNVKIYFQELNYELVEQVPANTIASVLGTTGGLLGLYIGFSLITVAEVFILIYDIITVTCKRMLFQ